MSVILIIGISLAAVGAAYLWGVPMIQKGQSTNQLQSAEATMLEIEKAIADVVQNGGQKSLSVTLEGPLEVSGTDNMVAYRVQTKLAGVASKEWVPLNSENTFGIGGTAQNKSIAVYGTDKASVLIARANPAGKEYATEYRLVYRELDDLETKNGRLVSIDSVGNNQALAGKHKLSISRESPQIASQPSKLGGALTVTKVLITVS